MYSQQSGINSSHGQNKGEGGMICNPERKNRTAVMKVYGSSGPDSDAFRDQTGYASL